MRVNPKIIFYIFLVIFLALLEMAFIKNLPIPLSFFSPIILALSFALFLYGLKGSLFVSTTAGIVFELYSFSFFGVIFISLVISALALNFLFQRLITNRSIYSFLVVNLFAFFCFRFILFLFYFFENRQSIFFSSFAEVFSAGLINAFFALAFFIIFRFFSKNLSPGFVEKNNKYFK